LIMKNETEIAEVPFEEAEYCVFDFETTGTAARNDKVIEIGIVKIRNGKIVDSFSSFINPGRPVPYYITQITGITSQDVQDAPYFDEVYSQIKEFIGDSVLVAHNLAFDHSFLKHECAFYELIVPENDAICTLKLARILYPSFPSKSLGNIVKQLRIRHRDIHRGLGDATATAKVLIRMFKPLRDEHGINTATELINFQKNPASAKPFKVIKKKLVDDYYKIPDSPGVYFFKNAKEEIIYVGKAKSLKDRLKNYFMNNAVRKSKDIVRRASRLGYQITNSELTALIAEAELIKIHMPKKNTLLKRYPQSYFIKISNQLHFPAVVVANTFEFDGENYFGPFTNRNTVHTMKEIADKTFMLRECTDKEYKKHKKCYLADIERCLSPCVNEMIVDEYKLEIEQVNEFLCGANQSAVDRLLNKMKELSSKHKFEEAAQVRDVVQSILSQLHKASILAEPINKANALIEILGIGKNDYLLLLEGKIIIKDYFMDRRDYFEDTLVDYFTGAIQTKKELTDKDLETLRITLSWLVKNKDKIKIHYLKNYQSIQEISQQMIFSRS
jgi:DNA polymerase III subunit epsilon